MWAPRTLKNSLRITNSIRFYNTQNGKLPIIQQISSKIKATGPITVADYMKEVLTNPLGGYYMHRDVFGETGDFITSPELNQMFGEMIAIWFLNEWSKLGCPKPFQIVELGPGRGTLSHDLLRIFHYFGALQEGSLHLVEVSPVLSDIQAKMLDLQESACDVNSLVYRKGIGYNGTPIKWYRNLDDVPNCFTLLVAHEFFDALPIHKFQKTENGYREILVDVDPSKEEAFRYVIARERTPSQILLKPTEHREHVEISPCSLMFMEKIAKRIEMDGGLALIADYGHNGTGTDTFRAFKQHKLHDPLVEPGEADLTADVDFSLLAKYATAAGGVKCLGPLPQRDFLLNMGIEHRYKVLLQNASPEQLKGLEFGYKMMTENDQMGERFKFLAVLPAVLEDFIKKYPVAGFFK